MENRSPPEWRELYLAGLGKRDAEAVPGRKSNMATETRALSATPPRPNLVRNRENQTTRKPI